MTLRVGDDVAIIAIKGPGGGRIAIRSGPVAVGDKVVLVPGAGGSRYAVRPASPSVGDKVILYPLRGGGHVCLVPAGSEGGGGEPGGIVKPPINFSAMRTGPPTADLKWALNEGNTAIRIVRRPDRYPTHINDGVVAYEGAGTKIVDSGLDGRYPYYYCAWGKSGSRYSNGYLMAVVGAWGIPDSVHVCDAWHRPVSHTGESVSYGPFSYFWDGLGRVYVSSSRIAPAGIQVDDVISISGPAGTVTPSLASSGGWHIGICEITSALVPGQNTISIEIRDTAGANIGTATPLYIMWAL